MVPLRVIAEALKSKVVWNGNKRSVHVTLSAANQPTIKSSNLSTFKVVIDPGHGGRETGAIYGGVQEKVINLAIAQELNKKLKSIGIKTYMTRNSDRYVGLYARSGYANGLGADLFISIHHNADLNRGTQGTMSLYYPYGGNTNGQLTAKQLAKIVQGKLVDKLSTENLGIIQRPYLAVLRTAKMPAVLAEIGYMSNKSEFKRINNATFRSQAAEALKEGVVEALKKIKK